MLKSTKALFTGIFQGAAITAVAVAVIALIVVTTIDALHRNDCQAAQDAMHTIAVNVDLFYSVEDMQQAAAPHIEFFTTQCTK